MTDLELDNIFKLRLGSSHSDALRDVFDAGYNLSGGLTPTITTVSPSISSVAVSVVAKLPVHTNK